MRRLLNIDLDKNDCIQENIVDTYDGAPLEEVIQKMREAAEGFENPQVEVQADEYDGPPVMIVYGHRPLTDAEREAHIKEREYTQARRKHMEEFEEKFRRLGY